MIYDHQIEQPAVYCAACGLFLGQGLSSASDHFCDFIPIHTIPADETAADDGKGAT